MFWILVVIFAVLLNTVAIATFSENEKNHPMVLLSLAGFLGSYALEYLKLVDNI